MFSKLRWLRQLAFQKLGHEGVLTRVEIGPSAQPSGLAYSAEPSAQLRLAGQPFGPSPICRPRADWTVGRSGPWSVEFGPSDQTLPGPLLPPSDFSFFGGRSALGGLGLAVRPFGAHCPTLLEGGVEGSLGRSALRASLAPLSTSFSFRNVQAPKGPFDRVNRRLTREGRCSVREVARRTARARRVCARGRVRPLGRTLFFAPKLDPHPPQLHFSSSIGRENPWISSKQVNLQ